MTASHVTSHGRMLDMTVLGAAFILSVGVLLALVLVRSASQPWSSSRATEVSHLHQGRTLTLLQENGWHLALIAALPAACVFIALMAMLMRWHRGRLGSGAAGWIVSGILLVLGLLGIMTVGTVILPIAALIGVLSAHRETRRPASQPPSLRGHR